MNRKAVIITNPGIKGQDNYCEGVFRDLQNYQNHLKSPQGGFWSDGEIQVLDKPSKANVTYLMQMLKGMDYVFFIFAGHGHYDEEKMTTMIGLNDWEDMDGRSLANSFPKVSIILDCCRKMRRLDEQVEAKNFANARNNALLDGEQYKSNYNQEIRDCSPGVVITYGCDIHEEAGDDSRLGGYYSSAILRNARDWAGSVSPKPGYYSRLSIVGAHNKATETVKARSGERQNPQIEKPKSAPYFPFAVVGG